MKKNGYILGTLAMAMLLSVSGCSASTTKNEDNKSDTVTTTQNVTEKATEKNSEKDKDETAAENNSIETGNISNVDTTNDSVNEIQDEVIKHIDLTGKRLDVATLELIALGVDSDNITARSDDGSMIIIPHNWEVLSYETADGEKLNRNSEVSIVCKKVEEEKTAQMINVVGIELDTAIKKLKKAGFNDIDFKSDNGKKIIKKSNWVVKEQNYYEGEILDMDVKIVLTCAKE